MYSLVPIQPSAAVFKTAAVKQAIQTALNEISADIRDDLEANTAGWNVPPKWVIVTAADRRDILTLDMIYRFQDKGTKAHVIMPKTARRLVFQVPAVGTVFARKVNHPGTRPQNWTRGAAEQWQAKVGPIFQTYIDRVY